MDWATASSAMDRWTSSVPRLEIVRRAILTVKAGAEAIVSAIDHRHRVQLRLVGHQPAHDAVAVGLLGGHDPPGEGQVGRHAVAGHLEQAGHAARVGDHPVDDLGQHHAGADGRHPHVAQQRPLERARR